MTQKKRIVFLINSLTSGGAERVLVDLLSGFEAKLADYETHLVLLDREDHRHTPPDFAILHCLDARFSLPRSIVSVTACIRRLKPDIVVSFLTRSNVAALIACRLTGTPCVISERVHTSRHLGGGPRAALQRAMIRATYPLADRIIAVSEAIRTDLSSRYGVRRDRIEVAHNPIDLDRIRARASEAPQIDMGPQDILALGRLTENKNFASLIDAFAWSGQPGRLVIVGEGPLRDDLVARAHRAGIGDRVVLPGYVDNPFPLLRIAKLFASASRAEGFPNAIVEALAVGCPVVSTDCLSGPREILQVDAGAAIAVGRCGILVPVDATAVLAEALNLASNRAVTESLVECGRRRAADYSVAASVERYWSIIQGAGRAPGADRSRHDVARAA